MKDQNKNSMHMHWMPFVSTALELMEKKLERITYWLSAAIVALMLLVLLTVMGCSDSAPAPVDPRDQRFDQLQGIWNLQTATLDGVPVQEYEEVSVELTRSSGGFIYSYSMESLPALSPWKAEGLWIFGTEIETEWIRDPDTDDEVAITYNLGANGTLTITFTFTGEGYSNRVASAGGDWVFEFSKPAQ